MSLTWPVYRIQGVAVKCLPKNKLWIISWCCHRCENTKYHRQLGMIRHLRCAQLSGRQILMTFKFQLYSETELDWQWLGNHEKCFEANFSWCWSLRTEKKNAYSKAKAPFTMCLLLWRILRSFKVNPEILLLFYRATIESIITYGINCCGSSIMTKDKERINRLIRKSEKIVKRTLTQIDCLYEDHAVKKAKTILKELIHPLNKQFLLSSRSGKIIQPIAKTERYRRSFVPSASALLRRLKSWDT